MRHTINVEELASQAAGNWRKFESFCWHDQPDDGEKWAIFNVSNRDSGILDQSNAEAIDAEMTPFMEANEPDVVAEHHNHFLCGWVNGYAIRVYRHTSDRFCDYSGPNADLWVKYGFCKKEVTPAFRRWCEILESLADYPLLDEEDYSRREYEATVENIREVGRRLVKDNPPDEWEGQVFTWLWDNEQSELENRDDQGGYPSEESVCEALLELGIIDPDVAEERFGEDWAMPETYYAVYEVDTWGDESRLGIFISEADAENLADRERRAGRNIRYEVRRLVKDRVLRKQATPQLDTWLSPQRGEK